jgi:Fe-S cluster assembly protein SufD
VNAVAHYIAAFGSAESGLAGSAEAWLRAKRADAAKRFETDGFPTTALEDWRYTDVSALTAVPFASAKSVSTNSAIELVEKVALADAHRLVFVDGVYIGEASRLAHVPEGVRVTNWAAALNDARDVLGAFAGEGGFAALNLAMMSDGALIRVPRGVRVEKPIEIIVIASDSTTPVASHLRNVIVLEAGAEARVVEHYISSANAVAFNNVVTEVTVKADASVHHVKVQREGASAFHIARIEVMQERASRFNSCSIAVGGALARTELASHLQGEGADCQMFGAYITGGRQLVDHHTTLHHNVPNCTSNELYKGVVGGMSRAVFNGTIKVAKDAQKTAAYQSNRNLVLSDGATVDTRPQLEIYADDVKCSHGATIGRLDDEALFYLRSRGIELPTARRLLTSAFAGEVVESIKDESVRALADSVVQRALADQSVGGLS